MSENRKKRKTETETEKETEKAEEKAEETETEEETEDEEEKGQARPARGRLQRVWFPNALLTCQQHVGSPTRF